MDIIPSLLRDVALFLSADPSVLLLQLLLVLAAGIVVFLVLFTARDILMRTDSFLMQVVCILLVAALPVVGFLLYLLVRPASTLTERALRRDVESLLRRLAESQTPRGGHKSQPSQRRPSQPSPSNKVIASA